MYNLCLIFSLRFQENWHYLVDSHRFYVASALHSVISKTAKTTFVFVSIASNEIDIDLIWEQQKNLIRSPGTKRQLRVAIVEVACSNTPNRYPSGMNCFRKIPVRLLFDSR